MYIIYNLLRMNIRILLAMTLSYWCGFYLDSYFHTSVMPLLTFMVPLLMVTSMCSKKSTFIDFMYDDVALPITVALFMAILAKYMFTNAIQQFVDMIAYEGSIYWLGLFTGIMIIMLRGIYILYEIFDDLVLSKNR
ncbi:MAG: hypothetical protein ACI9TY_000322 [Alphaproteobacteria bacterium]|jgi:hypothetical protein